MPLLKILRFALFVCLGVWINACGSLKVDPPQSKKTPLPPDVASNKYSQTRGMGN